MRLSKLEIYGFKSFAKRTEIVFPQNVTGIVGPNGSGKSNISDAVRWVLGEQSAKTLRGNSMADVIFNGTEMRKAMNYCEVTLVFDNTDHELPVDFAEVSITRRVYRSGESEYLMNGSACRLKDVVDLFRDTGVGKEGYSIIGQGRIDEILSQRSEDRRAVFEEAAGISRFRARKEEAEQRLKRADENLVRVEDVLEELNRQLVPLEKQAEVAKEYLALSETLRELDVELYLLRYGRLQTRSNAMEDALLAVQDQLVELESTLGALLAERDRQDAGLEQLQQALAEANAALLARSDALHRAREQAQQVENRLTSGQEALQRLEAEGNALRSRLKLIQATMTESDGGLAEADAQRAAAEAELAVREQAHEAAAQAAARWEEDLSTHKSAIIDRMNRMQDVRTAHARQSAMLSTMTARRAELAEALEGANEKEQTLQAALDAAKHALAGELALFETRRAEAAALEQRAQSLAEALQQTQAEEQALLQALRGSETRLATLRELQEGYEGYQYPVRQALTHARRQGMAGVHDVVAMLLTVPKEYETALDMALGGAMQNIVTQTEQDAKTLIDHLRSNRLGRATFLPLSAMHPRTLTQNERRVLAMPGCVGVASELCGFDARYRPVMESLLGRTVIAEDLESGIAIMRAGGQAFRLVTLAGDVMHSGGSMTGGSIQQKAQNLLGREREIKELEAALATQRINATALSDQLAAMQAERQALRERRIAAREAFQQQEIAVVRDTERQRTAQSELGDHRQATEGMRQAVEQLEEGIQGVTAELARIQEQSGREETDAQAMKGKTETLTMQLEAARREREAAQQAHTQAMLALKEAEHNCERIRHDQRRLVGDQQTCHQEMDAVAARREAVLADLAAAEQQRAAAAEAVTQAEAALARAKAHVEATEGSRAQAQQAFKDLQSEIEATRALHEKTTDRLHRQEMNLSRVKADMAQLNDRLWDTYELTYAGAQEQHAEYVLLRQRDAAAQAATPDPAGEPPTPDEPGALEAASTALPMGFAENQAEARATEIRERIKRMGNVNVAAIEEYAKLHERATELTAQRDDLTRAKGDLATLIQSLLSHMRTVFVGQFALLQGFFEQTFVRLFGGGHGEVRLSDPEDPLNCGIEIIVQPPGKKRQILSLFSGGERALTAIAILFAMLKLKPTPFCILDEIEAALDEANITYFADYLKEFSQGTQFVVVTHRKGTMERCDTLFGVAMEERGVSSMVSVSLQDFD
ncbi:MAG: chromosome segregation protein SMC [Candidatus Limiplasma sp.]|nr:chromosome segregation protein SMC [Candidatus Limiplasma sp.]